MIEEALNEARRLAHENRLEGKDMDELAELEDEEDEDFLEFYRCVTYPAALAQSSHHLHHKEYNTSLMLAALVARQSVSTDA